MTPRPNTSTSTESEERPTSAAPATGSNAETSNHSASAPCRAPAPVPVPNDVPALPFTAPPTCPKCGGRMWDNRASKRNPNAPDFKCRSRSCDGVVWPGHHTAAVPIFPPRMHDEGREGSDGSALAHPAASTAPTRNTADAANRPSTTQAAVATDTARTRQADTAPIAQQQRRLQPSAHDLAPDPERTARRPPHNVPPSFPNRTPAPVGRKPDGSCERVPQRAADRLDAHTPDRARADTPDRPSEEGKGERSIATASIPPHVPPPPLAAPLSRCDAYRNYLAVTEFVLAHVRPLYRDARIPCTDTTVAAIVATLFTATRRSATEPPQPPQPPQASNAQRHRQHHQQRGDRR